MKAEWSEYLESLERLTKDLRKAAITLSPHEARFLVDYYYDQQDRRKCADNQVRALTESGEPHEVIGWLAEQSRGLENNVKRALDAYSASQPLGEWARSQLGIGPVIAAGLLAHIDIEKATTAGSIWRFAGLDPTVKWEKKQKRPWNAALKTLCWKIGESFVKVSGKHNAFYGSIYVQRKHDETRNNENLFYAEQAAAGAARVGKKTEAYKHYIVGKLPPGHIHARAKRYAVKLFLSHYHEKGRKLLGLPVPLPYPIAHMGHTHLIAASAAS